MNTSENTHLPGRTPAKRWPRAIRWTLSILAGLAFVVVSALALGGWWLEHETLQREFRFGERGESTVRVHGGNFSWWALRFEADSAWFRSPTMDARLGKFSADADLFAGLLSFMPAAKIKADTVHVRLRADTATKQSSLDSLRMPDFRIPLALTLKVRRLVVEDDSGILARVDTLTAGNRGSRRASMKARAVRTRWTRELPVSAWAWADWSARDSIDVRAGVRRGEDFVTVKGRHAKDPLWKGRDAVEAAVEETAPYVRAIAGMHGVRNVSDVPAMKRVRLNASARLEKKPEVELSFGATGTAVKANEALTLSPQTIELKATWKNNRGGLRLQSRGMGGEDLLLEANGRVLPGLNKRVRGDSIPLWTRLEYASVTVRGHARGFHVRIQDTVRTADLEIERADWNGSRLEVALRTGDDSRLEAEGRRQPSGQFRATFGVDVKPKERWVRLFAGDKVSFAALRLDGEAAGTVEAPTVRATLAARALQAYGVKLDSVRSFHEYGPGGYTLRPSRLYDKKTVWTLEGSVSPSSDLVFRLSSPRHGSLEFAREGTGKGAGTDAGMMTAKAARFDAGALPYAFLDSLPFRDPVVDGVFAWNPDRRTGRADLAVQARFQTRSGARPGEKAKQKGKTREEDVEVRVKGAWDARRLDLKEASARLAGSEVSVAARVRLGGRQFYEVWKAKPAQYEQVSIRTPGLDIPRVMQVFLPEPPLVKGTVDGELSYGEKTGFEGRLTFHSITPREAIGDVVLKELSLEGMGDTLSVNARTTSESVKPLNARLRLGVSSLLRDVQHVSADLVAGDVKTGNGADTVLRMRIDANTRRFQSFQGTLKAQGRVALPQESGSVESLDIALDFNVPVIDPLHRATLATRTFKGTYTLPGQERQTFSLNPVLNGGVFRVSDFSIRNAQGQAVKGTLEYGLERGTLKAHLGGERFSAKWQDDFSVDVRNLDFDLARDAAGLRVSGGFSTAAFLYADAPLYARGTLSSVRLAYDAPAAAAGKGSARQRRENAPPTLTVSGSLSESLVRYRLKSFADLQKVFRRERKKRASPIRLNVNVRTLGSENRIDSDLLRLVWVGDLTVRGVNPYTLFNGRVNALSGGLGLDKQAYDMERLEVKWLNAPLEEGVVHMEARKQLASSCTRRNDPEVDSCTVITRLDGELAEMRFSYDSDCGGAYGSGASVAAILYSVQRGCYDASLVTGGDGRGYGNKALTLLEPTINRGLSNVIGRYSRNWIEATEVSGLGSLSGEDGGSGDTLGEALSLALTSKEYKRLRLRLRSGYHTASQDLSNPWEHMVALEWRPPAEYITRNERWRRRIDQNLRAVASLQTHPVRISEPEEDEIEKKIGLIYSYVFWGNWWSKPRKAVKPEQAVTPVVKPAQSTEGSK